MSATLIGKFIGMIFEQCRTSELNFGQISQSYNFHSISTIGSDIQLSAFFALISIVIAGTTGKMPVDTKHHPLKGA